jgi:hypothetical protein
MSAENTKVIQGVFDAKRADTVIGFVHNWLVGVNEKIGANTDLRERIFNGEGGASPEIFALALGLTTDVADRSSEMSDIGKMTAASRIVTLVEPLFSRVVAFQVEEARAAEAQGDDEIEVMRTEPVAEPANSAALTMG